MHATELAVLALVKNTDDSLLLHLCFQTAPALRGLEVINSLTPMVILNKLRLLRLRAELRDS